MQYDAGNAAILNTPEQPLTGPQMAMIGAAAVWPVALAGGIIANGDNIKPEALAPVNERPAIIKQIQQKDQPSLLEKYNIMDDLSKF